MSGLKDEFDDAVHRLHDDHHVEEVIALGVPRHALFGMRPLLGVADIDTDDSGFFTFIEDGRPALILPEGDPYDIGWLVIDELVAVDPTEPGNWWVRGGDVPILGRGVNDAYLDYCMTLGEPIPLLPTPWHWLIGGAKGLCLIDWAIDPLNEFHGLKLDYDSPELEKQLWTQTLKVAMAKFEALHA